MLARTKKAIDLAEGHRTKAEIETRKKQEQKFASNRIDKIKCPDYLSFEARKEFNRVVKAFAEIEGFAKLVNDLDIATLSIYADAYFNYKRLTEEIAVEGATMTYTNTKGESNVVVSAKVQAQMKYAEMIMKCATKLGLSVSDRLKLVVPEPDEQPKNKFAEFVK